MYEQDPRWDAYYDELDPKRRRQMLAEAEDDGANACRLRLWEARHRRTNRDAMEVDRLLYQFVSLTQVYRSARLFPKSAAREVLEAFKALEFPEVTALGEAGERALYWEIRNAARRYFQTCEGASYNRALFGLIASGDAARRDRVCADVWRMTRGLAQRTGLDEALRIWNHAVVDAYAQYEPDARARLDAYESGPKGKRRRHTV